MGLPALFYRPAVTSSAAEQPARQQKLAGIRVPRDYASVCACDLILTAQEDQLSLEDIILFFERAKAGKYGPIKSLISHYQVMTLLDKYRAERHEAFMKIKGEKDAELKTLGPTEKTCEEPKQIGEILKQASIFDMHKRKSG